MGKNIVEAAQGKSKRLTFIRGVSKEPELVREFAAVKGFELSTEFEETVADPRVQAVFLATPHSLHLGQISAVAAAGKPVWCEKPLGTHARRGRARHRRRREKPVCRSRSATTNAAFHACASSSASLRTEHSARSCISKATSATSIRPA